MTAKKQRHEDHLPFASLLLRGYVLHMVCFVVGFSVMPALGEAWPTYHGGADLRGFSESDLPAALERQWIHNTGGRIENTPVSNGEYIFAAPGKGRITALSMDGEKVWERTFTRTSDSGTELPLKFDAPLLCQDGLVFAGSSRGTLLALDAASGEERWRIDTGGILLGSPNVIDAEHLLVLDQGGGALHCIEIASGKTVWSTDGVERCDGSPGVGPGHIAFGSCLAALHVYDLEGRHLRDIEVGDEGQIAGGVAVDGNRAWFGTRDGRLICANLETGTIVWISEESSEQTFSTPAVGADRVVYTSDNGRIYAVSRDIGRTVWSVDAGGVPGSAVIAGDQVLVPVDGRLLLLHLTDGKLRWEQDISDDITSAAIVGDMVVIGADDGSVSAWSRRKDDDK